MIFTAPAGSVARMRLSIFSCSVFTIKMIAALSDLDEDEAGRLKAVDLTGLGELVADFVPDGLPTGATA